MTKPLVPIEVDKFLREGDFLDKLSYLISNKRYYSSPDINIGEGALENWLRSVPMETLFEIYNGYEVDIPKYKINIIAVDNLGESGSITSLRKIGSSTQTEIELSIYPMSIYEYNNDSCFSFTEQEIKESEFSWAWEFAEREVR